MELDDIHIGSKTRLRRMITAVDTAALSNFLPSSQELTDVYLQVAGDSLAILGGLLNPDPDEVMPCEEFERINRDSLAGLLED